MRIPRLAVPCVLLAALGAILWPLLSGRRPAATGASQPSEILPLISPTSAPIKTNAALQLSPRPARLSPLQSPYQNLHQNELAAWVVRCQSEPVLAEFAAWVEQAARGAALVTEEQGVALAERRSVRLAELIQADPQRALALAMPRDLIAALPARVAARTEEHVAGRGRLALLGAVPETGREKNFAANWRTATVNGKEYQAFTYGRRLGEPTRDNILLHGVALQSKQHGHLLAVHESPARLLGQTEVAQLKKKSAVLDPICALSGLSSTVYQEETVLEVGDENLFTCGVGHALKLQQQIAFADGAKSASGDPEPSAYTEGNKRLLFIRVDFPDLTGPPITDLAGLQLITNLNNYWRDASYGKVTVTMPGQGNGLRSDLTPTFRLANSAAYYGTNNFYDALRAAARTAADAAGFNRANYDFDIICIGAVPGFGWSGLGYVGATGSWIRNTASTGTTAHELGHNLGLNHANYWDTASTGTIGAGVNVEYGDSFDTMGGGGSARPYNARYRAYLNWLTPGDVATFSTNGVYRIMAYDLTNATGPRALKIVRNTGSDSTNQYWLEFHARSGSTKWELAGAALRWAGSGSQKSLLLDTTPGSPDGKNDAPIAIGRTFVDRVFNLWITPLRKAGTTPESLDIFVCKGAVASNLPPTVTISASTANPAANASVTFTATAGDPNNDALAYHWDFGDGNFGTNGAVISKSWPAGEYVVRCTVTDMRGGEASTHLIVRVGTPATYRISGRVLASGSPVQGARVFASSTRVTYTDTDGSYDLVNLGAASYTVGAVLEDYTFANLNFSNPVGVGPHAVNIDFFSGAAPPSPPRAVAITNPAPGIIFAEGSNLEVQASASAGTNGSITNVAFYLGDWKLGESMVNPYRATWSNALFGTYALTARASDSTGLTQTSAPVTLLVSRVVSPRGSVWKYLDDGTDQGTNWIAPAFDDGAWASGLARLGYGGGGEVTPVGFGPDAGAKYITTYFRRAFVLPPGTVASNLIVRFTRDDGVRIYADSREALRNNLPVQTSVTFATLASAQASNGDDTNFFEATLSASLLETHTTGHVLAAEVHQAAANSSDLGFDLELAVTGTLLPVVTLERWGSQLRLAWPAMPGNWNLYASGEPGPAGPWTLVNAPPAVTNGLRTLTIATPATREFYRLQNP